MIELKPMTLLLQGLPETIAMTALVCALIGKGFKWKKILLVGVLQGVSIYIVRLLPLTFGIHSIIAVFTQAAWSYLIIEGSLLKIIVSSFIAFVLLIIFEDLFLRSTLFYLGLTMTEASKNESFWIMLGWPQVVGLFITALVINRHNLRKGRVSGD